MDHFVERLVAKRKTTSEKLLQIFVGIGAISVAFFIVTMVVGLNISDNIKKHILFAAPLVAFAVLYFAWKYIRSFNIEYEITITNNDFDLDKIVAKTKRQEILSTTIDSFNEFAVYDKTKIDKSPYKTKIYVYNRGDENLWYASVRYKDLGNTLIVFSADEEMLNAIKPFLDWSIRKNAFGGN